LTPRRKIRRTREYIGWPQQHKVVEGKDREEEEEEEKGKEGIRKKSKRQVVEEAAGGMKEG
jgi:hypothetical protein